MFSGRAAAPSSSSEQVPAPPGAGHFDGRRGPAARRPGRGGWSIETGGKVAEAMTDGEGRFAITGLWDDPARSPLGAVNVFARDRSGRVGWELVHPLNLRRTPIRLAAVTEVQGRIVNRDGAPIAELEVIPRYLTEPRHGSVGVALSPDVAAWHAARTDTGGAFRLRDIPIGMSVSVVIDSARFARPAHHVGPETTRGDHAR